MKIYRFDIGAGQPIGAFDSVNFVMSKVAHLASEARVNCAYLGPDGKIGYHRAVVEQLMLIVQGEGWVRGEPEERISVTVGQAVYWSQGEWHATTTATGLTAIVIESELLDLADFMPLIETIDRS